MRRLTRTLAGGGRWTRPARVSFIVVALVIVSVLAGEVALYRWLHAAADPADTIVQAGALLRGHVRLASPLDVAWERALASTSAVDDDWRSLLDPPLPPAICPNPDPTGALGSAIAAVDAAIERGSHDDELQRRIQELRTAKPFSAGSQDEFLVRYNLARAYLAAGDASTAAETVEPVFDGFLNGDRLPAANFSAAERLVATDEVSTAAAALGFHARFLAGKAAYARGDVHTAIKHFRLAINAVNYLLAARAPDGLTTAGHYQRLSIDLGTHGCSPVRSASVTSIDAYAGLVAAYLAAPDFTDRGRLAPEVRRSRLQIDPDDPFRPVLRYAATTVARSRDAAIPENVLWAASNLQRVYHYNRLNPDPRLEVTRAVLLLHLTSRPEWVDALAETGEGDVCAMLSGIGEQLHREASAGTVRGRSAAGVADSARAAIALHTYARLNGSCAGWERAPVEASVRSAWIQRGAGMIGAELPALYDAWRAELERALESGAAGNTLRPVLTRVHAHRSAFASGRVPADLPASTPVAEGRAFVETWWRSVYADIAAALVNVATGEEGAVTAARAPQLLAVLQSAQRHAGVRPSALYAVRDLEPLARAGGDGAYLGYRVRYAALDNPAAVLLLLGLAFTAVAALAIAVHVNVWRYDLLTRRKLFQAESARRRRS